jgi:hypothetical protein
MTDTVPLHAAAKAPNLPLVGVASWLVPGLGHLLIGDKTRGIIFLIAITVTFWGGVAIGGVRSTIDPQNRKAWFMAQICGGANAIAGLTWSKRIQVDPDQPSDLLAYWPVDDIAVVYTGVAGLLNLLVVFDALGRADNRRLTIPPPRRAPPLGKGGGR